MVTQNLNKILHIMKEENHWSLFAKRARSCWPSQTAQYMEVWLAWEAYEIAWGGENPNVWGPWLKSLHWHKRRGKHPFWASLDISNCFPQLHIVIAVLLSTRDFLFNKSLPSWEALEGLIFIFSTSWLKAKAIPFSAVILAARAIVLLGLQWRFSHHHSGAQISEEEALMHPGDH